MDWDELLIAFLHDPPDKARSIVGHETRAAQCATAALGEDVTRQKIKSIASLADSLAAISERLPMPTAGVTGERAIGPETDGSLYVHHPLGAGSRVLSGPFRDFSDILGTIREIVAGIDEPQTRYLAIWRLLPEALPDLASLPADTRAPDHTIWHHADATASLFPALSMGAAGRAYLSFYLSPVQPFIAAARSVRDLWSGSAILSWLTFQAMLPVIEAYGPTALIFPSLRGAPLMDLWLIQKGGLSDRLPCVPNATTRPSIPNRFLAVVPWGPEGQVARDLANKCETAAKDAWTEIAESVKRSLDRELSQLDPAWSRRWEEQIASFFDIRTACLPERECGDGVLARLLGKQSFADAWPDAGAIRDLADRIPAAHRPTYDQENAGRWQAQVEFSARLMEALRAIRHVPPPPTLAAECSPKCSLLGSYEQLGPDELNACSDFWRKAVDKVHLGPVRLRKGERFCAVAMTKRFSVPAFLASRLGLEEELSFPDTATVAAALWLKAAEIDPSVERRWSGQWLHWRTPGAEPDEEAVPPPLWERILTARQPETCGAPPAYFAILSMDADHMGLWLRGDKAPAVRDVLHPRMREYFDALPNAAEVLKAHRPVGPALHAAISEGLTNFAVHIVPTVVEKYGGTLIYAGGDDVLALLPTRTALACSAELRSAFRGEQTVNNGAPSGYYRTGDRDLLVMGEHASVSAGIVVVHYKEDLRLVLNEARQAVERAKRRGRDAIELAAWRRSGERATALCSWRGLVWMERLIAAFVEGATDRWAYRLRAELPTLQGISVPLEAVQAEIRRQVDRTELTSRELLSPRDPSRAGALLAENFAEYCEMRRQRIAHDNETQERASSPSVQGKMLADFITLCQTASFLARGRDA